jgi:hypothetical protein
MTPTLRAEFFFDDETSTWHFRVPALHIIGGGAGSREDAHQECVDAIAFVLEGDPAEYDQTSQAVSFEMSVSPAA